jgi:Na+/H+ antiporter NhaC
MFEHPYGPLSLLPPLAAIVLAIVTRRVVFSLCSGVFLGALILSGGNPWRAVAAMLEDHLWTSLTDPAHLRVFAFTALMGAMVGVVHRSGGMLGVVQLLAPWARGRRSGQIVTWLLGLAVFFDDYANTLLLGTTLRPLADRLGISREKLAYLADSTAAPVAGLALVSTWVAGEIGFIQAGFAGLDTGAGEVDAFRIFVATIPYRFYVLWALMLVPLVALLGRDIGSMWHAERRALAERRQRDESPADRAQSVHADVPPRWHNAVLPVLVVIGVTGWLLVATGRQSLIGETREPSAESGAATVPAEQVDPPAPANRPVPGWLDSFAAGDSYLALLYGSLAGLVTAVLWVRWQGTVPWDELRAAGLGGARQMLPALIVLWLAWALSAMTDQDRLGTAVYLGQLLEGRISAPWLPTAVFVLSSLVAFSTGTSWGTMGILMPLVIRVAWQVLSADGRPDAIHDPLLLATIGSVLAGAIFGDHCSPLSDTTILSSHASGCGHVEHVRTQLPYAMLAGGVAILLGTLPVGFGANPWLMPPLAAAALVIGLFWFGRRVDVP